MVLSAHLRSLLIMKRAYRWLLVALPLCLLLGAGPSSAGAETVSETPAMVESGEGHLIYQRGWLINFCYGVCTSWYCCIFIHLPS